MDGVSESQVRTSSPGKVILHGEHAVVYGKAAIAASLNLRCHITCKYVTESTQTILDLPDIGVYKTFDVAELQQCMKGFTTTGTIQDPDAATEDTMCALRNFAKIPSDSSDAKSAAVVTFLYLYSEIYKTQSDLPPVKISMSSEIPVGAGLGSSAAFSVCMSAALLQLSGHIQSHKVKEDEASWSASDQAIINKWAFIGEKIIHGKPSGIDNSVSTYGGALRFQKGTLSTIEKMPTISIMLVNTKVPRSTKVLVEGFRQKYTKYPNVFGPILDSVEAITQNAQEVFAQLCEVNNSTSAECFSSLGDLVGLNNQILNMMGVGHPALDKIVATARSHGLPAKLTGAGGGGCAFVILPPGTDDAVVDTLSSEMETFGYQVWKKTSVGSQGVTHHL